MIKKIVERALVAHKIATKQARVEVIRRNAATASAYLRGREIAEALGTAGDVDPHELALAVAASHDFRRRGTDKVWAVKSHDFRDRACQKASKAVAQATAAVDKRIKSARIAARPKRNLRTKAQKPTIQVYHG